MSTARTQRPIRQQARRKNFVRECGTYPNKYLYLGPCPEDNRFGSGGDRYCSNGGQRTGQSCLSDYECGSYYREYDVECDHGECCTVPQQSILYWETCENGGYFMSAGCSTDADCPATGANQVDINDQIGQLAQVCVNNECCTTANTEIGDISLPTSDSLVDPESWNDECANQGYYLGQDCDRDADCNRIPNLRLQRDQQLSCIEGACCVSPRRLPRGAQTWLDICPSGGQFVGTFCEEDRDCGMDRKRQVQRICEEERYCCTDPNGQILPGPRNPRGGDIEDRCDDPEDQLTAATCADDFDCVAANEEYCGNTGYCCISTTRIINPTVLDPRRCSNGGRRLGLSCETDLDCNGGQFGMRTRACLDNGVCCTVPGTDPYDPNTSILNPNPVEPEPVIEPEIEGPITSYAFCYNKQRSRIQCTSQSRCKSNQGCVNGLCCTRTGDEWQNACGGSTAVSSCFTDDTRTLRSCNSNLFCTASNFCCECPYGQASTKCSGGCPPGYICETNGYCCPRCPTGDLPYGSCYDNQCADNYICRPGNICCPI
ncbi:hypothetical protein DdX_03046 [Ditylenchus destructor]|uniref:Uncharacterized protein n=1 Tax=Ditylenchus destructor TaxID=166010 RepID=A0AAD4R6J6_9BILA|nr:hypothetical protein DdX_03046 [Ditylenchus destructor]